MNAQGGRRRKLLRRDYQGEQITVSFDIKRCLYAQECVRRAPTAFEKERRPWILPDREDEEAVREAVLACPTGALRLEHVTRTAKEQTPETNTIWVMADGPLYVRGDLEVVDEEGKQLHLDTRVALCRCGLSNNKPFCDNAHLEAGFSAEGLRRVDITVPPQESASGRLRITPTVDGPYVVQGPTAIVGISKAGRSVESGGQEDLCRCGQSQAKPYCDGSHRRLGFRGESW